MISIKQMHRKHKIFYLESTSKSYDFIAIFFVRVGFGYRNYLSEHLKLEFPVLKVSAAPIWTKFSFSSWFYNVCFEKCLKKWKNCFVFKICLRVRTIFFLMLVHPKFRFQVYLSAYLPTRFPSLFVIESHVGNIPLSLLVY